MKTHEKEESSLYRVYVPVQVQSPPNRSSSMIRTDFFNVPLANFAAVNPAEPPPTTTISYDGNNDDDNTLSSSSLPDLALEEKARNLVYLLLSFIMRPTKFLFA